MPDGVVAALLPLVVLAAALGVLALGAVLDALAVGAPVASAVVAPLSEAARVVRRRGGAPIGLLRQAAATVLAVLLMEAVLLDPPGGAAWVVVLAVPAAALVDRRRTVVAIASSAAPLVVAVAGPAVAAGTLALDGIASAQRDLWFAVQMPVAVLVLLLVLAAAGPRAADPAPSLGRAALLVSGAAAVVALFVGVAGPGWLLLAVGVVVLVLVGLARAVPDLPTARPARLLLLPLALVQLAVVVVLRATS